MSKKSFKVAVIGAGSVGFTRDMMKDLFSVTAFRNIELAFTDINQHNLDMVMQLVDKDLKANGIDIKIQGTLNRREAFKNAKYIFNFVRIGMLEAFRNDVMIPLAYGLDQCVGDTLCAGGIMYGQRGVVEMLAFCKDIREVAHPDCLMLNYANPNAMVTWACNEFGKVPTIGLCHGVQNGHKLIAEAFGLTRDDLEITCVGINHQTWYTKVIKKETGEDMLPGLLHALESHPTIAAREKVRIDVLKRFGYFSTESNGHLSEYLPWYRKDVEKIADWISMDAWIHGESCGYYRFCVERRNWYEIDFPQWLAEPAFVYPDENNGIEHGAHIIEALETGRAYRGHFNVVNHGAITNLPDDAVVELPCYVDQTGVHVPHYGALPLGCAAICNASISVQRMAVHAAVAGDVALLKQAMMMDPLTGATLTPDEIWQMTDEMLVAGAQWLPQYAEAIEQAKVRLANAYVQPAGKKSPNTFKERKTLEELSALENAKATYSRAANRN